MRTSVAMFLIILIVMSITTGCAAGPNPAKGIPGEQGKVAGFWLGIWHGFIAPFVFVISFFKSGLSIYEVHNNGAWYNLGYLFGVMCFFGGGGNKAARRK